MKQIFKKIIIILLILESKLILKKYKPKIIAITGSVGKTSTKDAIYSVLLSNCHIRKSDKSFNGEIGVPLTIIGCQNGWNDPFIWIKTPEVNAHSLFPTTNAAPSDAYSNSQKPYMFYYDFI